MRKLSALMDLQERVAIITGGAGHIGKAAAESLLELGAKVYLMDVTAESLSMAKTELASLGDVETCQCNIADESALRRAIDDIILSSKRLDILVHSAAYTGSSKMPGWAEPFEKQSAGAFDSAMRTNVTAAFVMAQQAQSALADSNGSIILISSIYGVVGPDMRIYQGTAMQNPVGYGASKGALLQLVRYLATLMAPVRVNAISPGGVSRNYPPEFVNQYNARTPLGRMATEEDIKGAVAYLASDLSAYVTGHNLMVDGGWTAW